MCLRRKDQPRGFVGPAVAYLECYDPESGASAAPTTWNPVYDAATPPPIDRPASDCTEVKRSHTSAHCGWIWGLIILSLLGVLVFGGLAWIGKRHGDDTGGPLRSALDSITSRDRDAHSADGARPKCWRL
jgi:hypothetical protein